MERVKLRYWAIQMGEFVELRVWSKQPVRVISQLKRKHTTMKRKYSRDQFGQAVWTMAPMEVETSLKQVLYVGGKVQGVVKYNDAAYHIILSTDGRTELTREMKNLILKKCKNYA